MSETTTTPQITTTSSNIPISPIPVKMVNNIYNIATPGEFLWLITNGNNMLISSTRFIKIINDIDMKNQPIEIINDIPYNLLNIIFDGNNKKISNLNISNYNLFNEVNKDSKIKNITFDNYKCNGLVNINNGEITNCVFKNGNCPLVLYNYNIISNLQFDNINLVVTNVTNESGVVSIYSEGNITNCKIKNVTFDGSNGYGGGISGIIEQNGYITSCSVENIKIKENSNINIGGLCGILKSGTIEKCKINIPNFNKNNMGMIVAKLSNTNNIINCITFKTSKDDTEDNKVDLKYNREKENEKRSGITNKANTITTTTTTTTTTIKISDIKMILIKEYRSNFTIKNIFKHNSENKMSKWDYEGIVFDDSNCSIELPLVKLNKSINDTDVDKIKKHLKDTIKSKALLNVDIKSDIVDDILTITISDLPTITSVNTTTNSSAEHFATPITQIIYVYNTNNNVEVMDAMNDIPADLSDILTPVISDSITGSSFIYYIILFLQFILLIFIALKITHTI